MTTLSFSSVSSIPTAPQKTDPDTFAARGDAYFVALDTFESQMNTVLTELNKITSGLHQGTAIAAYSGAATYSFPDVVAGTDGHTYRCVDVSVTGVDPTTDDGTYWYQITANTAGLPPAGSIFYWTGGYFGGGSNQTFTNVVANSVSTVNAIVNNDGWYVCDGSALNLPNSSIFNGANRYLPNLTDDRFLMGDTVAGATGGVNDNSHNHTLVHTHSFNIGSFSSSSTSFSTGHMASHNHGGDRASVTSGSGGDIANDAAGADWYLSSTGSGWSHNHSVNPPATTSGAASTSTMGVPSVTENRPKFLAGFYIMRAV